MSSVDKLPFELAVQTVVTDVWYSNALPEWYTPEQIDEAERSARLIQRARRYLAGERPLPVLRLQVPRLTGGTRAWVMPAVNDQMIMQACVANLATEVAKNFDRARVFSHAPNDDPNRLAFMKPQIAALMDFHNQTIKRLQQGDLVLMFDIEKAFASIDRGDFYRFLDRLKPDGVEIELIRLLLDAWTGTDDGIPLVNDSVFFLGGAYLSVADREIAQITGDFIRYVDDYRVFGRDQSELEVTFERISRALASLGLRMNPRKVRIGSRSNVVGPLPTPQFADIDAGGSVVVLDSGIKDQLDPDQLAALVSRALESPSDYLNEGVGRCLLGALRRYRLNNAIHRRASEDAKLAQRLQTALVNNSGALRLTAARLAEYGKDPQSAWRAIWVIYLIEQQGRGKEHASELAQIEADAQMPAEVKLWARRCREGIGGEPKELDDGLHDMSYLDAGQRCYGAQLCRGEGF